MANAVSIVELQTMFIGTNINIILFNIQKQTWLKTLWFSTENIKN